MRIARSRSIRSINHHFKHKTTKLQNISIDMMFRMENVLLDFLGTHFYYSIIVFHHIDYRNSLNKFSFQSVTKKIHED